MYTIFMNSKNFKTSDSYRLVFSLSNNIDLKRGDKHAALSNLSIYYAWKNVNTSKKLWIENIMPNMMDHIHDEFISSTWWIIFCILFFVSRLFQVHYQKIMKQWVIILP